jgi:hypothetical protein
MLTDNQRQLMRASNRRLAIVGMFRKDDARERHVFSNSGGDATINKEGFFRLIKPELRVIIKGRPLKIGDSLFNRSELQAPLQAASDSVPMPISIDSPLLEDRAYTVPRGEMYQQQGARLFEDLLTNLDVVACFSNSRFPRALLKLCSDYTLLYANEQIKNEKIAMSYWLDLFGRDHQINAAALRYLTCYVEDEEANLERFGQRLTASSKLTPQQIDKLTEALRGLKNCLITRNDTDPIYQIIEAIRKEGSTLEDRENDYSWLSDYGTSQIYGLGTAMTDAKKPGHSTFFAYYERFIRASDEIHKFIRSEPLRSYLFCFLASKYYAHSELEITLAADRMFEIGVEGQGEKRIPGESKEDRERNVELIRNAVLDPALQTRIGSDSNYEKFASAVQEGIVDTLTPERSFSAKALRERLRRLFVFLGQLSEGTAGELLNSNQLFNEAHRKFFYAILNTQAPADGEKASLETFRARLGELCRGKKEDLDFIESFLAPLQSKPVEAFGELRRAVKEAFVAAFAKRSKTRFAQAWVDNRGTIDSEATILGDLYDLRLGMDVDASAPAASAPSLILTRVSAAMREKHQKERASELAKAATQSSSAAPPTQVKAPLPATPEMNDLASDTELPLVKGDKKLGTLKKGAGELTLTAMDPSTAEEIASADAEIEFPGDKPKIKLQTLNIKQVDDFAVRKRRASQISELVASHDKLSKVQDTLWNGYVNVAKPSELLNRNFRSLILGEYILSAPAKDVQLGQFDTSCMLGVMMDMVEHVGDFRLGKKLFENKPSENLNTLPDINLSLYYPVGDASELSDLLQYHYERCHNLQKVQAFVRETAELKAFFEVAKGSNLEIIFINTTLSEHAKKPALAQLFICDGPPAIAYLTEQSDAEAGLVSIGEKVGKAIKDPAGAANLQVPIFVCSHNIAADLSVPFVGPNVVKLPEVQVVKNTLPGSSPAILSDHVIQGRPFLLLSAILLTPTLDVGRVSDPRDDALNDATLRDLGVEIKPGEPIRDFLRRVWLDFGGQLIGIVVMAKWINMAILETRVSEEADLRQDIGKRIARLYKTKENYEAAFSGGFSRLAIGGTVVLAEVDRKPKSVEDEDGRFPLDRVFGARFNVGTTVFPFKNVEWRKLMQNAM